MQPFSASGSVIHHRQDLPTSARNCFPAAVSNTLRLVRARVGHQFVAPAPESADLAAVANIQAGSGAPEMQLFRNSNKVRR